MGGENRSNFNLAQRRESLLDGHSRFTHSHQGAAKGACQGLVGEFTGPPPPLAVIGLSQIGQFEINRKCLGHAIRLWNAKPGNDASGLLHLFRTRMRTGGMGSRLNQ